MQRHFDHLDLTLREHPDGMAYCREHLTRWVRRDRNHPSVIDPSYAGFLRKEGVRPQCREAYEIQVKSFAPIAVYDKDYDELGPFPPPPTLKAGVVAQRRLIVYNDAFSDEAVELRWQAILADKSRAGDTRTLRIPLGAHMIVDIAFTPPAPGELRLDLVSVKGGKEQFRDSRVFAVE